MSWSRWYRDSAVITCSKYFIMAALKVHANDCETVYIAPADLFKLRYTSDRSVFRIATASTQNPIYPVRCGLLLKPDQDMIIKIILGTYRTLVNIIIASWKVALLTCHGEDTVLRLPGAPVHNWYLEQAASGLSMKLVDTKCSDVWILHLPTEVCGWSTSLWANGRAVECIAALRDLSSVIEIILL